MRKLGPSDVLVPRLREVTPETIGWVARPDLGPRTWQNPKTGTVYELAEGERFHMVMLDNVTDEEG